jgi:4-amino-4-deoxy-L-arabinose transferase-like glycosyltransferase
MQKVLAERPTLWLYFFIIMAALLNCSGLFVPVMGPDGALYASIAKTMAQHNNFTDLFVQGQDWLDKPHFPFWVTAVFFKLFGPTTWAYKLPGVLFVMLAAVYTYKLAKALYGKEIALWAVLILLTAQHIIICTMDVRAEPYLTGLIMASVYHFQKSLNKQWFLHLLLASAFAACAVMTKGIFALIPIGGAIAGELLVKKDWKMVFNFRWLVAIVFILLLITPELYTLYMQFDLHPEKTVFGHQNVSGLRFFFWDSQFGRFFNNGPIKKNSGDPTFFLHTILWAYLPWSLVLYAAIYQFFRKYFKQPKQAEWYCITGSLLTLLIFSVSKFQLPFYIVIVFPFFSILCAQYICGLQSEKTFRLIKSIQIVIGAAMVLVVILLQYFFNPANFTFYTVILLLFPVILFFYITRSGLPGRFKILYQTCAIVFFVNLYFNCAYYPRLLKYQADSEAAFWINANNPNHLPVVQTRIGFGFALDFYTQAPMYFQRNDGASVLPHTPYLLYADTDVIEQYIKAGKAIQRLKSFESYRITRLKGAFLNQATRSATLTTTEVVLVK